MQIKSQRSQAIELVQKGILASQVDKQAEAFEFFQQSITSDPTWGVPHFLIGSEYAANKVFEKAEIAFANAVLLSPELSIARYQLGLLQFTTGRAALALVSWQNLLHLPEGDPLPHFVRAYAELAQDNFEQALDFFQSGLDRNTENIALTEDVRKVMARVTEFLKSQATPMPHPVDANDVPSPSGSHILLSNYLIQSRQN